MGLPSEEISFQSATQAQELSSERGVLNALGAALICVLVLLVYFSVFTKLAADWWQIADYSYGMLIPPLAVYILWRKRGLLRALPRDPSWNGVGITTLALGVLLVGTYGAELFLSRLSFLILLVGLTLCFAGPSHARSLGFFYFLLLVSIPLPAIVLNQITFPLQIIASKGASALLPLFGVPVLRQGNIIQLPSMKLEVAEACSGIRSLMSLFALSTVYGYFLEESVPRRILLALASVPIAIAANSFRIVGTGLSVQYLTPDWAEGFFHLFSGWVVFLFSIACLYGVQRILRLRLFKGVAR